MSEFPTIYVPPDPGLTEQEKQCLRHLAMAFNDFVAIKGKVPNEDMEFAQAIDSANRFIGMRVARRVNPEIWRQPEAVIETEPQSEGG
jgi:hypothetical protein